MNPQPIFFSKVIIDPILIVVIASLICFSSCHPLFLLADWYFFS